MLLLRVQLAQLLQRQVVPHLRHGGGAVFLGGEDGLAGRVDPLEVALLENHQFLILFFLEELAFLLVFAVQGKHKKAGLELSVAKLSFGLLDNLAVLLVSLHQFGGDMEQRRDCI